MGNSVKIIDLLWDAYQAGAFDVPNQPWNRDEVEIRAGFDRWLAERLAPPAHVTQRIPAETVDHLRALSKADQ